MRYSFRLAEVVGHVPDPRKRPGTIKAICEYTGLDRHQVASLLKNEVKYIPLDALSKLCEYLIDRGFATAEELPGRLFGVEPEHFWELLARRKRLELCLGVRRGDPTDTLDDAWVVASDSVLLGELLSGVTTLGGTVLHRRSKAAKLAKGATAPPRKLRSPPARSIRIRSICINRWSGVPARSISTNAGRWPAPRTRTFTGTAGDKALVCLGSNKSNPVVELLLASAFGCEPFESQDGVGRSGQPQLPDLPALPRSTTRSPLRAAAACGWPAGTRPTSRASTTPRPAASGKSAPGTKNGTTRRSCSTSTANRRGTWRWPWGASRAGRRGFWPA